MSPNRTYGYVDSRVSGKQLNIIYFRESGAKTERNMKENVNKLTINKINEYPQEYSIMSVEEQMMAKGGAIITTTLLIAGIGKVAVSWSTAKKAAALITIAGAVIWCMDKCSSSYGDGDGNNNNTQIKQVNGNVFIINVPDGASVTISINNDGSVTTCDYGDGCGGVCNCGQPCCD